MIIKLISLFFILIMISCSRQDLRVYHNSSPRILDNNDNKPKVYYSNKFFRDMGTFDGIITIKINKDSSEVIIDSNHENTIKFKAPKNFIIENNNRLYFRHKNRFYFVAIKKLKKL